jgi:hypothetical protein
MSFSQAHAQFFDYSVVFENGSGTPVTTVNSGDSTASLAISNAANNSGLFAGATGTNANLLTFLTTSSSASTSSSTGTFNFPYQIAVTLVPSDINGVPLTGDTPQTKVITGTLSGNLTQNVNNLSNTYNNIVNTSGGALIGGPAAVLDYSFTDGSIFEVRALVADFNPGSPPGGANGQGTIDSRILGSTALATPEPGAWALFCGMGVSGAAFLRRRTRRK